MADDPSLAIPNTPNFINPAYATPEQRKQLYQYANALTAPQPIKSGWQGLASIANALVGGYMHHQADLAEQGGTSADQQRQQIINQVSGANGALAPSASSAPAASIGAPPAAAPGPAAGAAPGYPDTAAAQSYAAQAAPKYGIEPKAAAAMVAQEYGDGSSYLGDGGSSGGPLQLHYGGVNPKMPRPGLGDAFTAATGLDARDPKNWQATIDFGLANASKQGWEPWKNSRDKLGWSNSTGIGAPAVPDQSAAAADIAARERAAGTGGNLTQAQATAIATGQAPPAGASGGPVDRLAAGLIPGTNGGMGGNGAPPAPPLPPPRPPGLAYAPASAPPAIAAMGAALRGAPTPTGAPQPAPAGALPLPPGVTPQQLAFAMSSPNMSPAQKMQLQEWAQPKMYQDVNGNVAPSYFNRPTGAPIANLGRQDEVSIGSDGSVHVPVQTTGPIGAGTTRLFGQPLASGGAATGAGGVLAPITDLGNEARANANTQNQIATQKSAWAQQNLDAQKQETALRFSAAPLYQLKGILDQNGGQLPTGVGADKVMDFGSAANFITSLLGKQLDTADTPDKISSLQLLNKYGMQLQQAMAAGILPGNATNASLESAGHTSPGIGLSNTVNVHLIDNLTRMNDLRIKYAHDYQQYYKSNKGDMSDWNNAWVNSISGDKAIPLSKYPVKEGEAPDGTPSGLYASTDPSGFHWFKKAAVQ